MNVRLLGFLGLSFLLGTAACEVKDDNANDSLFTTSGAATTTTPTTSSTTSTSGEESGDSDASTSGDSATTDGSTSGDPTTDGSTTGDPSTTDGSTSGDPSTTGDPSTSTTTTTGDPSTTTTTTDDGSCPQGTEGCPCYGNNTCDAGLECQGGVCVTPTMNTQPYGDPALGCLATETSVTVNGFTGEFCSPECPGGSDAECPAPGNASATPRCVLNLSSGTPCSTDADCTATSEICDTATLTCQSPNSTNCALLCDLPGMAGNGSCQVGAQCQDGGVGVGICMWP